MFWKIGKNQINEEAIEAILKLFIKLSKLTLELLDVSVNKLIFIYYVI